MGDGMKIFISWSGDLSHKIAVCLREWLPNVIQSVTPYVSSEDIDKGTRWSQDIADELSTSFYGILCVTKDNLNAPWLNFEAGALSKTIENTRVSPFLFDLKRSDVHGPILQFQSTVFEKEDFRKLVAGIKSADPECKIDDIRLNSIFDVWWPKLEESINELLKTPNSRQTKGNIATSPKEEILEQILELTRQNTRALAQQEKLFNHALNVSIDSSRRLPGIEPDHPVFRDVQSTLAMIRKFSVHSEAAPNLIDATDRLEAQISYLFERLGYEGETRSVNRLLDKKDSFRRIRNALAPIDIDRPLKDG
jgi:hypothetical protein